MLLTRKDLKWNIAAYSLISKLNILPLQVTRNWDRKSKSVVTKITEQTVKRRLFFQRIWSFLFGLHVTVLGMNLLRLILYPSVTDKLFYFPFLLVAFFAVTCGFCGHIIISCLWPDLNVLMIREVTSGLENSSAKENDTRQDSIQLTRLFIIYLPFTFSCLGLVFIVLYFYDPLLPVNIYPLLYHVGTLDLQTLQFAKCALLVVYCAQFVPFLVTVYHVACLTLLFIQTLSLRIESMNLNIVSRAKNNAINSWRTHRMLVNMCSQFRSLQLLTNYFNLCFCNVIFLLKIAAMTGAVMTGYLAIQYRHSNPTLALMNFVLALEVSVMFIIMFDKAFAIPEQTNEVKMELESVSVTYTRGYMRKMVRAELKSLKINGIKVGQFRTLERESTPNFIDFVLN